MGISEILSVAIDLAVEGFTTDAGMTVDDVRRDLNMGEWELALGMLVDVSDEHQQPTRFWQLLADAAGLLQLDRSVAWCHWRSYESIHGVIRAELVLDSPETGGRRSAIPGAGVLRPMWDIGHRTSSGGPDLAIARIWVEYAPSPEPGQQGTVRLAPLRPERWQHLAPGDMITMHEIALPIGTAEIISVLPPAGSE